MERQQPFDVDKVLQETVLAVYDLVNSQYARPTTQQMQEARIASERIDRGFHTLRSVLSPSQIIGMVAREILMNKDKKPKEKPDIITSEYEGMINKDA